MMPAGTYYIGDLCYVMHDEWDEFCALTIDGNAVLDGEFTLKDGRRFATYGTAFGDGCYPASNGANLGVDAGLIGCIRVEDIAPSDKNNIKLGTIVTFDAPFNTGEKEGSICFGHIIVLTGYDEEYNDECADYDYSEDEFV